MANPDQAPQAAVRADHAGPPDAATPAPTQAPADARAQFTGAAPDFRRLMVRGAALLAVTLGIYRFWLTTDMRRFLWSQTLLGGEPLEYSGTATELLIGFLVAIAILVPINGAFFLATLGLGSAGDFASLGGFVALIVLGHYAVYRARRYRLTRTIFRGVRLHQGGSALRYAARAMLWWSLAALTLGLAYPWMQASLERYKFRHTYYGDLQARFVGSGTRLFLRGLPMWVLVFAPLLGGIAAMIAAVDWSSLGDVSDLDPGEIVNRLAAAEVGAAIVLFGGGLAIAVAFAVMLYPAFQMMVLRWWLAGIRFGDVTVHTSLRSRQMYGIYARFVGWSLLLGISLGIAAGMAVGFFQLLGGARIDSELASVIGPFAILVLYVVGALAFSTLYQVVIRLAIWRIAVDSLTLSGFDAVEHVTAQGSASSPVGEGLADALGSGGW